MREAESRLPPEADFMSAQAASHTSNVDKFKLAEPLEIVAKDASLQKQVNKTEVETTQPTTARSVSEENIEEENDDQDLPPTPPSNLSTFVDPIDEVKTKNETKTGENIPKIILAQRGTLDAFFGLDQNKFLSESLQKLQTRWESRIRQLTEPFQNGYSIILKASNSFNFPETNESDAGASSSSNSIDNEEKVVTDLSDLPQITSNTQKTASKPVGFNYNLQRGGVVSPSKSDDDESSQTLRMASLALISKLFNVLHSHSKLYLLKSVKYV